MNEKRIQADINALISKYEIMAETLQERTDEAINQHQEVKAHQIDMQREVYLKVINDLKKIKAIYFNKKENTSYGTNTETDGTAG